MSTNLNVEVIMMKMKVCGLWKHFGGWVESKCTVHVNLTFKVR